jgi:DNA (cytosine-5)-methyltransferase 1
MGNGRKNERQARGKDPAAPVCVDLFCGAGGFSEGLRQAGLHTVAANDFDPWAGATFDANHKRFGTKLVLGDIERPAVQEALLDAIGDIEVDVVVGGPPCQAFSQVRNHKRVIDDPRNHLYRHYVAMIAKIRPRVFVMENVPGLENLGGGAVRQQIIDDLALNGDYRVASRVVDAAMFGVPQTRLRVLFVGVRSDLAAEPQFPEGPRFFDELPTLERTPDSRTRSGWTYRHVRSLLNERAFKVLQEPSDARLVTVEQAIGDLTHLRPSPRLVRKPSDDPTEYESRPTSAYQRARRAGSEALYNADVPSIRADTVARLSALPPGGNFRDLPEALSARYLSGTKWGPELGRDNLSRKYFFAYRKLHPDHVSWTLNTKADCVFHYSRARALTVREFGRLHSFDDTYHFLFGDRHSRYRQVGNAVPPLLARAIGNAVRNVLDAHDKRGSNVDALAAD